MIPLDEWKAKDTLAMLFFSMSIFKTLCFRFQRTSSNDEAQSGEARLNQSP